MSASAPTKELRIGLVLFPRATQLDVTGPYEVFARMPDTRVFLVAATGAPVPSEHGLTFLPHVTFDGAPPLDVLCVPGGVGVSAAMEDERLLRFLQTQAETTRYVTSICTGALVLGAAGLLRGYRATTHWLSLDLLRLFGAEPVDARVVVDRNRITGGGVTAGIDFGLLVAAALFDPIVAQEIQLTIEYNPAPPFVSGSPATAPPRLVEQVVRKRQQLQSDRRIIAQRAAARLEGGAWRPVERGAHDGELAPDGSEASTGGTSGDLEGVALDSLEPGTTIVVHTHNSQYRFVVLFGPYVVLTKGGAAFPETAIVRLEGASTADGLKRGWILVGGHLEMWLGQVRLRSSCVSAVSITRRGWLGALWSFGGHTPDRSS